MRTDNANISHSLFIRSRLLFRVSGYIAVFICGVYIGNAQLLSRLSEYTIERNVINTDNLNKVSSGSSELAMTRSHYSGNESLSSRNDQNDRSFLGISRTYNTDKVSTHHYESLYEKYLHKYIGSDVYLLEIGLGCDMSYGPGASAYVWRNYLGSRAHLYTVEYDSDCGEVWYHTAGYTVSILQSLRNIDFIWI